MQTLWIYRFDGTVQCDSGSREVTLEEMRAGLEAIVGEQNVRGMEKRSLPTVELCGVPTGVVNAYEVTAEGWMLLNHGVVGNPGFALWPESRAPHVSKEVSPGLVLGMSVRSIPSSIKDLIGRPLRVYTTGDAITKDWRPERVNIEVNVNQHVIDIWFG